MPCTEEHIFDLHALSFTINTLICKHLYTPHYILYVPDLFKTCVIVALSNLCLNYLSLSCHTFTHACWVVYSASPLPTLPSLS